MIWAGVSTPELVFYRFAFGLPPLLAWITWSGNYSAWRTQRPMAHVFFMLYQIGFGVRGKINRLPLAQAVVRYQSLGPLLRPGDQPSDFVGRRGE